MKTLLMGSICLFLFASSILVIQVSCSKSNAQNNNAAVSQVGKLLFVKDAQLWTMNNDGTSQTQIPIVLPSGVNFAFGNYPQWGLAISPDGQKVFFSAINTNPSPYTLEMYSANIDGSGLTLLINNGPALGFSPMIAY